MRMHSVDGSFVSVGPIGGRSDEASPPGVAEPKESES